MVDVKDLWFLEWERDAKQFHIDLVLKSIRLNRSHIINGKKHSCWQPIGIFSSLESANTYAEELVIQFPEVFKR